MTDYNKQAADFLAKYGITFSFKLANKKLPTWAESKERQNNHFTVTFKRGDKKLSFDFFGSQNDYRNGKQEIDAYSVLACCSSDYYCPETVEDFCGEFGYDEDSRKAEKLHKACLKQSKKLQAFFSGEEMVENLMEIT